MGGLSPSDITFNSRFKTILIISKGFTIHGSTLAGTTRQNEFLFTHIRENMVEPRRIRQRN